jgi:acylphosphatase
MKKEEKARAHLFIEGIVQGVFYRAFTRNVAAKRGLSGWVKNLYDGRVEAVFEGSRQLIEQAVGECRKGPAGAMVSNIDVEWEPFSGAEQGFEIRY